MSNLRDVTSTILEEGTDLQIDENDWKLIRDLLPADGKLDRDDLLALLDLRSRAHSACAAFDSYFFPRFKSYLLADGAISPNEQFLLMRLLYGGNIIDDRERQFLDEVRSELREVTPEFEAMYRQVMRD